MGCGSSKNNLETVDDSVHVMLAHDKKVAAKKGQSTATGYKPRAQHPLLSGAETGGGADSAAAAAGAAGGAGTTTTSTSTADGTSSENAPAAAQASS